MLSDQIKTIDRSSVRTLFAIVGVMAIFALLAAMAILTDGEVKKAESRQSQLTTQRVAMAQCFENTFGTASSSCTRQINNVDGLNRVSSNAADNSPMAPEVTSIGAWGESAKSVAFTAR